MKLKSPSPRDRSEQRAPVNGLQVVGVQIAERTPYNELNAARPSPRASSVVPSPLRDNGADSRAIPAGLPAVLILRAEQSAAEWTRERVRVVHPNAQCQITTMIARAEAILAARNVDLFITAVDVPDGDVLDLLLRCDQVHCRAGRTLVIASRPAARLVVTLRTLEVNGVLDLASEKADAIDHALRIIESGRSSWSQSANAPFHDETGKIVLYQLTACEQLALAIMGDGCSNRVAAARLGMTYVAIRKIRHRLHLKLEVHDNEGLMREAARLGYTRFTLNGVTTFGLGMLIKEYRERRKYSAALPPALLASCLL